MSIGEVEKYLLHSIKNGSIHVALIDPDKTTPKKASSIANSAEKAGTSAILIGGSTVADTRHLDSVVKNVKKSVDIPVILFPNNVTGISKYADAIWFLSLLNSTNPYFIVGAQVLGAPLVHKYGLEAIPVAYIIVGDGGTAGYLGHARPIPYKRADLAAAYSLAAKYMGMRFVYLEAGSGAEKCVPAKMIRAVKKMCNLPLIVGGGIRTGEHMRKVCEAGADIVVTGTVLEESEVYNKVKEFLAAIR